MRVVGLCYSWRWEADSELEPTDEKALAEMKKTGCPDDVVQMIW